jgi:hypothetical protein
MEVSSDDLAKQELDLRKREVVAREREVALKEREATNSRWLNPLVLGVFAAAVGLLGNIVVAVVNNRSTLELEKFRSQSSLVLEAIKTGSPEQACINLKAFINAGLIEDRGNTIETKCTSSPSTAPYLPTSAGPFGGTQPFLDSSGQLQFSIQGVVVDAFTGASIDKARVSIRPLGGELETDAQGKFSFPVPPKSVGMPLVITTEKEGYKSDSVTAIAYPAAPFTIQLHRK